MSLPPDRRSQRRIAISVLAALVVVGFTPLAAAQDALGAPSTFPVPQQVGEVTWPLVALATIYMLRDARPSLSLHVHVEVAEGSRKWVEDLWGQFRRTFRRTFDKDEPPSDG